MCTWSSAGTNSSLPEPDAAGGAWPVALRLAGLDPHRDRPGPAQVFSRSEEIAFAPESDSADNFLSADSAGGRNPAPVLRRASARGRGREFLDQRRRGYFAGLRYAELRRPVHVAVNPAALSQ